MGGRRKARVLALQALYEADTTKHDADAIIRRLVAEREIAEENRAFAIELVSIPTYVLIALSRVDGRASEAAVKYFFLGAMSAAILAYGLSYSIDCKDKRQITMMAL